MMQFIKSNKVVIIGGLLLAVLLFVYFTFFANSSDNTALLTTTSEEDLSPVSRDLLVTLSNLQTIRLDNSIFTNPVFMSLTSFGVQIPLENVGRSNPFAPLPK